MSGNKNKPGHLGLGRATRRSIVGALIASMLMPTLSGAQVGRAGGFRAGFQFLNTTGVSPPAVVSANVISGVVGGTLTNTPGTYTNSPTIAYQWQKKAGAAYTDIAGETNATLASVWATHGNNIRCKEIATNSGGSVVQYTLPALYWGLAGTRNFLATEKRSNPGAGAYALNSRAIQKARGAITQLKVVFANKYWDRGSGKQELSATGNVSWTAIVEYPVGTLHGRFLFSGSNTGSAAPGATLTSDALTGLSIPDGATYAITFYQSTPTDQNILFSGGYTSGGYNYTPSNSGIGDVMEYGASVPDRTGSPGTITQTVPGATQAASYPLAVLTLTRAPTAYLISDSQGAFGDTSDSTGDLGILCRSVGPSIAYLGTVFQGETVGVNPGGGSGGAKANFAFRAGLAQYVSHVVCSMSVNDVYSLVGNKSAATVWADLQTLYALMPNTPIYQTTTTPSPASTDSWATTTNQTADSSNAARVSLANTYIRATAAPLAGYFDIAAGLENVLDTGINKTTGVANGYQIDANHYKQAGYVFIKNTGAVNPALLTR